MYKHVKVPFLILLFFLFNSCSEKEVKEPYKNTQWIKSDSIKITNDFNKIKQYAKLKEYKKSIKLCRKLITKNGKNKLAKKYYILGYYFKKDNQIDSAYHYYIKSCKLHLKNKDTLEFAKQLLKIAKLESNQGFFNKSDSSAVYALKYLKKENNLKSSIYNCLGINTRNKKEYKEALKWYSLAITTTLDSVKKLRYINNQASVYIDLNDYENTINNYKKINNSEYYDNLPLDLKAIITDNSAFVRFLDNQNVKEVTFLEAQKIKKSIKDNYGLVANYSHLSDFLKNKDTKRSLGYAYKMYELSKKINLPKDRIEALDKIINLENNIEVRKFAKERNRLSDSIQLAKQQSQNKFAKIIYNYEEEEKQKLKAQVSLEQEKVKNAFIIFVGIIVLILLLIYLKFKHQKAKKEKVIEVYKTETRLAKKIHDELANDVYLIMNKAQDVNNQNISLLPDLQKIYALTRDISHENSIIITGNEFDAFLRQLFAEFHKESCKVFIKGLTDIAINDLSKEKQIVVYRVLQELLVNMKKHSKATLVGINFLEEKGTIFIKYKDNGVGIDALKSKKGIQNMDTRIKSIKGLFNFESQEGKGFKVSIQFKK